MNIKKFVKRATTVSLTTAMLVGGGAQAFAKEKDNMDYKENYGFSHITRSDMLKIPEQQKSAQFKVPQFDASTIKNLASAKGYDEQGNLIDLDVWDSWPLQNADGTVANYHGYNIVFALAGDPKRGWDTFIYMFYQKVGDTSIDSWKNAGRVFKDSDKFVPNDPYSQISSRRMVRFCNLNIGWKSSLILYRSSRLGPRITGFMVNKP